LRVPLIVLVIPPAFACGKGAAASDYELESPGLAAGAVGRHQLTPFNGEYRQRREIAMCARKSAETAGTCVQGHEWRRMQTSGGKPI